MAKRKRLSPAITQPSDVADIGVSDVAKGTSKSNVLSAAVAGPARAGVAPPIAHVGADSAAMAALEEVSAELSAARREGRMVVSLPLDAVDETELVRDRVGLDADEMDTLCRSLKSRGQQTPIEVVEIGNGRYGLISGWRRLMALRSLQDHKGREGGNPGHVLALIRTPDTASDAYRAMVEENEIRAGLSFYERARICVRAVEKGVFPDLAAAVRGLFAATSSSRRSKISGFAVLVEQLDGVLRFPTSIPERLGLALAGALRSDSRFRDRVVADLQKADVSDASSERKALEAALKARSTFAGTRAVPSADVVPGVAIKVGRQRAMLSGSAVDRQLIDDLRDWLRARNQSQ